LKSPFDQDPEQFSLFEYQSIISENKINKGMKESSPKITESDKSSKFAGRLGVRRSKINVSPKYYSLNENIKKVCFVILFIN